MKRIPDYTEEREQIVKEMGYYIPLPLDMVTKNDQE